MFFYAHFLRIAAAGLQRRALCGRELGKDIGVLGLQARDLALRGVVFVLQVHEQVVHFLVELDVWRAAT